MTETFHAGSEEETAAAGREIVRSLPPDALIWLSGDLGAGKTTLVRTMAEALGADPADVASPTFAVVHEYPVPNTPPVIHVDCYRLSDNRREWMEIGLPELFRGPGYKFVEWPKEGFRAFATPSLEIHISVDENDGRTILVSWGLVSW